MYVQIKTCTSDLKQKLYTDIKKDSLFIIEWMFNTEYKDYWWSNSGWSKNVSDVEINEWFK